VNCIHPAYFFPKPKATLKNKAHVKKKGLGAYLHCFPRSETALVLQWKVTLVFSQQTHQDLWSLS
jgi:hypothetical protein